MEKRKVSFKVSSALKSLIGRELITNNLVAVFELVKNSFDASSKNIEIIFNFNKKSIEINDDGCGMSSDEIISKWLFIGYSEKKNQIDKNLSGNKGIGRFSCDRLGSLLELNSIKNGILSSISIDWDSFELDQETEIQDNFLDLSIVETNKGNGTRLAISGLRDNWTLKDIEKTIDQLKKLLSPDKYKKQCSIRVKVLDENLVEIKNELIFNDLFDYMKDKSIFIETNVLDEKIVSQLFDKGKRVVYNESKNNSGLSNISICLFFAGKNAKSIFKRKTGYDLLNYGNLYVYRNQFRVYPYGETGYDIFGLDQRKTQGYNRYLGTRELFGWIDIIDKTNHFVETTSRDKGFIENIYLSNLVDIYFEYAHKPLEKYVQLINYGNIELEEFNEYKIVDLVDEEIRKIFKFSESIVTKLDEEHINEKTEKNSLEKLSVLDELSAKEKNQILKDVKNQIITKNKELEIVKKENKKIKNENDKLEKEVALKNKFIENENPSRQKVLEHDLSIVSAYLSDIRDHLIEKKDTSLNEDLYRIVWSINRLNGIRKFLLRTNMKTEHKNLISFSDFYVEYSKLSKISDIKVLIIENEKFEIHSNVFDLITIYDNILTNAVSLDASYLKIITNKNSIIFETDTIFDSNDDINRIFDFGYTTKENGTGIGLYLIKQICSEMGLSIKATSFKDVHKFQLEISKNAK